MGGERLMNGFMKCQNYENEKCPVNCTPESCPHYMKIDSLVQLTRYQEKHGSNLSKLLGGN